MAMDEYLIDTHPAVVGFGPVRSLLRGADVSGWPTPALLGLRLLDPDHPAGAVVTGAASLTDAARAHDQIRFFLRDRVVRNCRDAARAWVADHGPCRVRIMHCEHLDEGSRLFLETLATVSDTVEVDLHVGGPVAATGGAQGQDGDRRTERERRIERLSASAGRLDDEDLSFLYQQAVRYLGVGDSWTAARILRLMLDHRPTPAVFARLGVAYTMLGRTMEAEFCYQRSRAGSVGVERAGADYALAMLYARHHPASLRSLDSTAEYLESGYRTLSELDEDEVGDADDLTFHKVFNRNGYALVEFRRGNVQQALGHLVDGIQALDTDSARNHMHQTVLLYNLAQCYRRMNDHPAAIRTYRQLLQIDSNMPEYHLELAQCYLDIDDPTAALPILNKALELGPSIPEVHSLRGFAELRRGAAANAVAAYRDAYRLDRTDLDTAYDYAYALAENDEPEAALTVLRPIDVTALTPDRAADLLTLRAEQHARVGRLEQAHLELRQALVLVPDRADAQENLQRLAGAMA